MGRIYKKIFAVPKSKEKIASVPFPFAGSRDVKPRCLSRVGEVEGCDNHVRLKPGFHGSISECFQKRGPHMPMLS